eukprot:g6408.t1
MDQLELRVYGAGIRPLLVQLGYLRSVSLASKGHLPKPEGLSDSWADFAVLLQFFECEDSGDMDLRTECEARLLCRSLQQLQKFGVPFEPKEELPEWVALRARAAYAALSSEDVALALKKWRETSTPVEVGSCAGLPCTGLSLRSLVEDATQALWEAFYSPAVLGRKPDPTLAAGWCVAWGRECEAFSCWATASRGNTGWCSGLLGWVHRMRTASLWMKAATVPGNVAEGKLKRMPGDFDEKQRAALGRVLLAYSVLRPKVGYCQGLNFIVAVQLLENFCEGYYEESMRGLLRDIAVLDALLLLLLPKIHARFAEVDLPLLWIAAEPLLTLFSRELRTIDAWNSEVWGVKGSVGLLSR